VQYNDLSVGRWFNWILKFLIPLEAIVLLVWWFGREWDTKMWWNPVSPFSLATCLFQWGVLILILLLFNNSFYRWVTRRDQ
jgi:NSS family neurotransmitter:Na+ symporter